MDMSDLHSREQLAGYDRACLEGSVVALVGCGAAGNNIAVNLALSGVGEVRLIDPDTVEPSNLTRSPLFRRERLVGGRVRYKAHEVALGSLAHSYATAPVVRYANKPIEALGLGAFAGVGVVIAAVDSFRVRAYLSDAAQYLGIPFVEVGFLAPDGHVSVFAHREPTAACWRCLHPTIPKGGFSCEIYAALAASQGRIGATQTLAATFGAMTAEAAIQALHGAFPLEGRVWSLDTRTGRASTLTITPNDGCPAHHRPRADILTLDVPSDAPLAAVFTALEAHGGTPVVHLPEPFTVEAPCARCGATVSVRRPTSAISTPPVCRKSCADARGDTRKAARIVHGIAAGDALTRTSCRSLGLPPGAIFEVVDEVSYATRVVRLAGGPDDLFTTLRRASSASPEPVGSSAERSPATTSNRGEEDAPEA